MKHDNNRYDLFIMHPFHLWRKDLIRDGIPLRFSSLRDVKEMLLSSKLTLELTHGKKSPMLKIPREAPWVIPLKLMAICKWRDEASITKCIWFQDNLQYCCDMFWPAKQFPVSLQQKPVQHTQSPPPPLLSSSGCQSPAETTYDWTRLCKSLPEQQLPWNWSQLTWN